MENQLVWFQTRFRHYRIPKSLFTNEQYNTLSPLAKLIYGFLLDRMCLSATNGANWQDKNGEYFVFFTIQELSQQCGCGHDKASQLLKELEKANLIRRAPQGRGRPSRIFVLPFAAEKTGSPESENRISSSLDSRSHDVWKSDANYTDKINTDINNTDLSSGWTREDIKNIVKDNISYEVLLQEIDSAQLDGILNLIVDTLSSRQSTVYIFGEPLPQSQVKDRFYLLDEMHIRYVSDRLKAETQIIHSPRNYILSRLYEAPDVMDAYYQAREKHDAYKEDHTK